MFPRDALIKLWPTIFRPKKPDDKNNRHDAKEPLGRAPACFGGGAKETFQTLGAKRDLAITQKMLEAIP